MLRIAPGERHGIRGQVGSPEKRARLVPGEGECQVARAGACIEDDGLAALRDVLAQSKQCGVPEQLGFLARDQRARAGQQLDAHEFLPSGEVREGLAGEPPADQLAQPAVRLGRNRAQRRGDGALHGQGRARSGMPERGERGRHGLFRLVGKLPQSCGQALLAFAMQRAVDRAQALISGTGSTSAGPACR